MCCNARRFHFLRTADHSGVSGTGDGIAFGVMFSDGQIALHWEGEHPSINIYRSEQDLMFVHGHGGATKIVWDDPPISDTKPNSKKDKRKKNGN